MSIISLILFLIFIGVLLYIVDVLIPMDARIRQVVHIVVVIAVLLYILQAFGLLGGSTIRLK